MTVTLTVEGDRSARIASAKLIWQVKCNREYFLLWKLMRRQQDCIVSRHIQKAVSTADDCKQARYRRYEVLNGGCVVSALGSLVSRLRENGAVAEPKSHEQRNL
jgi:hypothetical protein